MIFLGLMKSYLDDNAVTMTSNRVSSDKFKSIMALRKRLNVVNQEIKKIDQAILKLFENASELSLAIVLLFFYL